MQSQPEGPESPEPAQGENHRTHDLQRMLDDLIVNRRGLIAAFRAAFAAHRFDVTGYTDDELGRAICKDSRPDEALSSHARLTQVFAQLQSPR